MEQGKSRVRVAALKVADGNLEKLNEVIKTAKRDYRDVLAAEYPEYSRRSGALGSDITELPRKDKERILEADWAQYEKWLRG